MMRLTARLINRTAAAVRFFYSSLRPARGEDYIYAQKHRLINRYNEVSDTESTFLDWYKLSNQVGKNAKMPSVQVRKNVKSLLIQVGKNAKKLLIQVRKNVMI